MKQLTAVEYKAELETFEGFCNRAMDSMNKEIETLSAEIIKPIGDNTDDTEKYKDQCNEKINELKERKDGYIKFINYLMEQTGFLQAPASTKYHMCIPHGLLVHTNLVVKTGLKLSKALGTGLPEHKIIIPFQAHDIGKHNQYKPNEPTEKQKKYGYPASIPYSFDDKQLYNEHESRSLYMISQFIRLDEEEWVAIMYHNSPWDGITKCAFKQNKILTLLQMSDYWSSVYLEERP